MKPYRNFCLLIRFLNILKKNEKIIMKNILIFLCKKNKFIIFVPKLEKQTRRLYESRNSKKVR